MFPNAIAIPLLILAAQGVSPASSLPETLSRMNEAAASFHSMTANVRHITHTAVINDDSEETGTVKMRKTQAGQVQGLMDFTAPDRKIFLFEDRKASIYTPAGNTVEVYDLGKHGKQLDQFLFTGFGISRADLESGYDIAAKGTEKIQGQPADHIELIPRSKDALQYVKRLELWIPLDRGNPVQEQLHEPSGDYILVIYSNLKINPPMSDSDLRLSLPKGVQYIYPQK